MLALKIAAPEHGILELVFYGFENLYRLRIGKPYEIARHDVRKSVDKTFVYEIIQKFKLCGASFHDVRNYVLYHRFRHIHIVRKIGESHFGFYHPEFRRVPCGVRSFGSESRTESVNVSERHRICLRGKLTRNGEACLLLEKVLRIIHLAVLFRNVIKVERRHLEHRARAFAIAARDKRSVNVNEALRIEKLVNGERRLASYSENRAERVRSRP